MSRSFCAWARVAGSAPRPVAIRARAKSPMRPQSVVPGMNPGNSPELAASSASSHATAPSAAALESSAPTAAGPTRRTASTATRDALITRRGADRRLDRWSVALVMVPPGVVTRGNRKPVPAGSDVRFPRRTVSKHLSPVSVLRLARLIRVTTWVAVVPTVAGQRRIPTDFPNKGDASSECVSCPPLRTCPSEHPCA